MTEIINDLLNLWDVYKLMSFPECEYTVETPKIEEFLAKDPSE